MRALTKVSFPLIGKELELEAESRVSDACELAGVPLNLVCGGNGTCNKCRVDIIERGRELNVQACSYPISEGMEILVSEESSRYQLLETVLNEPLSLDPSTVVYTFARADLKIERNGFCFDAIKALFGDLELGAPALDVIVKMNALVNRDDIEKIAAVVSKNNVVDFVLGEDVSVYGVAFDIGTTSVVGILYDLKTGKPQTRCSMLNSQIQYGDDVISRIDFAYQNPQNRELETKAIHTTVDAILEKLLQDKGIQRDDIYEIVYCGNSTMQHLFLGLDPEALGKSPFIGTIAHAVRIPAEHFDIAINPKGEHVYMPLLGGFVGADTTACLLTLPRDGKKRMMIDLGTNGEIAIQTPSGVHVASAACGPALEGAGLSGGMRGTEGAIEKFSFHDGEFQFQVIGGGSPTGYCGSGIVDIIATLLRIGILRDDGRFIEGEELESHPLKERLRTDGDGLCYFVLIESSENPNGKQIVVTQRDVRAVQLAKSAIYSGYVLLSKACDVKGCELDEVALAGAFGNYIDIDNAQYIGLVPLIDGVKVVSIGNAASIGAQRYLLSCGERQVAERIRESAIHVELASNPDFQSTFMGNMNFLDHMEF